MDHENYIVLTMFANRIEKSTQDREGMWNYAQDFKIPLEEVEWFEDKSPSGTIIQDPLKQIAIVKQ